MSRGEVSRNSRDRAAVLPRARHGPLPSNMCMSEGDWSVFLGHAWATLAKFEVREAKQREVVALVQSLKKDIVG